MSRSLVGVPASRHVGMPEEEVVLTVPGAGEVPCVIEVTEDAVELARDDARRGGGGGGGGVPLRCTSHEPITVFSLTLAPRTPDKIGIHEALRSLLGRSAVIEEDAGRMTRLVQSTVTRRHLRHRSSASSSTLEAWWPIACGSDAVDAGAFARVSRAADDGTLASLLGTEVVMWSIGNRDDDKARYAAKSLPTAPRRTPK